jgi:phosphoribosyl 1,2-cyclic phosphodiesterase
LITHDHADHIKAVGVISNEYNIPVYSTRDVHGGIERNYCVPKKVPADNCRFIEKDARVKIGDFYVTPFAVPHDSAGNVGYRIETDDITFCLMTDVGHVTEEMQKYISEANYLVIEANYDKEMLWNGSYPQHLKVRIDGPAGHLSNNDCAEAIANYATTKLKHVWLCHLSEENNHPELARKTVEQILRSHGVIPGKDVELEVLKRKTPTGVYELSI